ncbi:DUF1822 family protein [Microcoleus sp. FACHB-1515]|uniref:DUF1822 family protein n=1 Tax=Cyanophyceae TaxID=3028117 RepID=UPI001687F1F9|nr:DUF1822 family protein [Microcoleus sp. FACHB-1515]MBD2088582.1 DUF1822 family protein [Microcoleus sp. FACHB-1515]
MPIPLKAHQMAQQFRQQQSDTKKAKQVYLNTLAVYAVSQYLKWLGIEIELEASDSWNAIAHTLADVADLQIAHKGKLECRPVLPHQTICYVPREVWKERIGFIAVQLDADLQEAILLGFASTVTTEELSFDQLRSLDDLVDYLGTIEPAKPAAIAQLGQWLQGAVEAGWSTIDQLLREPLLSFRSSVESATPTLRAKSIGLNGAQIVLVIGVLAIAEAEVDVWVRICSEDSTAQLPSELELAILDAAGASVMQAQARSTEMIQLKFSAVWGEQFSIKIALNDASVTEAFVV